MEVDDFIEELEEQNFLDPLDEEIRRLEAE